MQSLALSSNQITSNSILEYQIQMSFKTFVSVCIATVIFTFMFCMMLVYKFRQSLDKVNSIPNVQKLEENNLPLKTDAQKLEEKIIDILFRLQYFNPCNDLAYQKCIICRQNSVSKTSGHVIHDFTRKWELILCCVKCKELPKKTNDHRHAIRRMRNNTNLVTDEEMTLLMNESSYRHKLKFPELYISKKL